MSGAFNNFMILGRKNYVPQAYVLISTDDTRKIQSVNHAIFSRVLRNNAEVKVSEHASVKTLTTCQFDKFKNMPAKNSTVSRFLFAPHTSCYSHQELFEWTFHSLSCKCFFILGMVIQNWLNGRFEGVRPQALGRQCSRRAVRITAIEESISLKVQANAQSISFACHPRCPSRTLSTISL